MDLLFQLPDLMRFMDMTALNLLSVVERDSNVCRSSLVDLLTEKVVA